MAQHCLKNVKY